MYLNSVGIRAGNPSTLSVVDISNELLSEIIVSKLSQGYDGLKRLIYEQRPLLTDRIIAKINDYIQDSSNSSITISKNIKNESAFFNKKGPFCKNGVHNPLTKHLAEDCRQLKKKKGKKKSLDKSEKVKHTEITQFKESNSSDNESHVVKLSKAFKARSNSSKISIYLDSAASCHMVGSLDLFSNFKKGSFRVQTADGLHTAALGSGYISFEYRGKIITLKCIYVPEIKKNLISMGKLWKKGFLIKKLPNDFLSVRWGDFTIEDGCVKDNMFHLSLFFTKAYQLRVSKLSESTLHNRAVHPNDEVLRHMFPQAKNPPFREACAVGKSHQLLYKGKLRKAPYSGHTVHSDLSGKISPSTVGSCQYYMKFMDDFSKFEIMYILNNDSEACEAIKNYVNQVKKLKTSLLKSWLMTMVESIYWLMSKILLKKKE
ncbi:hypothetical protein O181_006119 [Austropuccinia psidii MF-1]|uniref:Retrovirus-related Pol polyprotein from transposon TNT 1-94-like beta-barrel domain-containing protein n=1 Tax=Austropuccinia psidii MF-1 TaxID=1389203 RepID=A0A9Q3GGJ4_9BASI|nr:hypothetical protein [Austropuccinia psidii MF-1]